MASPRDIYLATRKKHDQIFNQYLARPLAAVLVSVVAPTPLTPNQLTLFSTVMMVSAAACFALVPGGYGLVAAIVCLEVSFLFDCADGMLARHRGIASKVGHLFDFFTDELKALLVVGGVGLRLWQEGGLLPWGGRAAPMQHTFLLATLAAVFVVASALSLTNFVRRPELTGQETPIHAHYEQGDNAAPQGLVKRLVGLAFTLLRGLNHYPANIWLFAAIGRLDVFFWMYAGLNALYLVKGWLGLVWRFGRS